MERKITMKITILSTKLLNTVKLLQGIIPKRKTMPILGNILMKTNSHKKNNLTLTVTNLNISIQISISCDIKLNGSTTIPTKLLFNVIKTFPSKLITIKNLLTKEVDISCEKIRLKLLPLNIADFPKVPKFTNKKYYSINSILFVKMITKTIFSASSDENRYNLTGIYMEKIKEKIIFVATDGHRLSLISETVENNILNFPKPKILPKKGLLKLLKIISKNKYKSLIKINLTESHAIFKIQETILSMRLIDGNFPDYRQVVPQQYKKLFMVKKNNIITCLKRVSSLSFHNNQPIKFKMFNNELLILCSNPEVGELKDSIDIKFPFKKMEFGLNTKYLIEALESISDINIVFKLNNPFAPILITGDKNKKHFCIVMPMKI